MFCRKEYCHRSPLTPKGAIPPRQCGSGSPGTCPDFIGRESEGSDGSKIIITLFFFMLVSMHLFAQNNLLSPDSAIAIALKNNYSIQISRNESEALKNLNSPGFAGMLPQVNANASTNSAVNNTKQEFSNPAVSPIDKKNVNIDNLSAGVALVWTLFDGTKMFVTKEKLSEQSLQGENNLKADIENTIEKIITSYYSIIQQKQVLKAIDEELAYSQERLKIAERKLSNGSGSKLDVLQAKTDMNAQRSSQLVQQTHLEELKNNLNVLLARKPETEFTVADTVIIYYNPQLEQLRTSYEGNHYSTAVIFFLKIKMRRVLFC
jgi:outer membrane protein TolC